MVFTQSYTHNIYDAVRRESCYLLLLIFSQDMQVASNRGGGTFGLFFQLSVRNHDDGWLD